MYLFNLKYRGLHCLNRKLKYFKITCRNHVIMKLILESLCFRQQKKIFNICETLRAFKPIRYAFGNHTCGKYGSSRSFLLWRWLVRSPFLFENVLLKLGCMYWWRAMGKVLCLFNGKNVWPMRQFPGIGQRSTLGVRGIPCSLSWVSKRLFSLSLQGIIRARIREFRRIKSKRCSHPHRSTKSI